MRWTDEKIEPGAVYGLGKLSKSRAVAYNHAQKPEGRGSSQRPSRGGGHGKTPVLVKKAILKNNQFITAKKPGKDSQSSQSNVAIFAQNHAQGHRSQTILSKGNATGFPAILNLYMASTHSLRNLQKEVKNTKKQINLLNYEAEQEVRDKMVRNAPLIYQDRPGSLLQRQRGNIQRSEAALSGSKNEDGQQSVSVVADNINKLAAT